MPSGRLVLFLALSSLFHLLLVGLLIGIPFGGRLPLAGGDDSVVVEISTSPHPLLTKEGESLHTLPFVRGGLGWGKSSDLKGPGSGPVGTDPLLAEIRRRIERAKRYPYFAERESLEGKVVLGFRINAAGEPESIEVEAGSGIKLLDDEAVATLRRAAPYPVYKNKLSVSLFYSARISP